MVSVINIVVLLLETLRVFKMSFKAISVTTWDNVRDGRYRCPLQTKSFFRNLSFTPSEIICILQNSIKLRPNVHSQTRLCY